MRAKLLTAVAASGLIVLGAASTAGASVTVGQLSPLSPADTTCNGGPFDTVQPTVTDGNSYVVPSTIAAGTVTSWSHNASTDSGQSLTMKFWRLVGGTTHVVVGHDGPRSITASTVNTFSGLSIPVRAGDVLGISPNGLGLNNGCGFDVTGDRWLYNPGTNLVDGQQGTFGSTRDDNRLNVTAVLNPTNTFTLGAITRNKKKGTATLTVADLPNPGELTASGKGVNTASVATISKAVTPGAATLLIKAKGKKKRKLNDTGKVKLNATISYTPTGGTASTHSRKVKLKKNL